jgi:predicted anti-sigma-YlaC factor YlaD
MVNDWVPKPCTCVAENTLEPVMAARLLAVSVALASRSALPSLELSSVVRMVLTQVPGLVGDTSAVTWQVPFPLTSAAGMVPPLSATVVLVKLAVPPQVLPRMAWTSIPDGMVSVSARLVAATTAEL